MNSVLTRIGAGVFVALSLTACGGEDEPSIEGFWFSEIDEVCAANLDLTDGVYTSGLGCALENGGIGFDVEIGRYTISGDEITVTPEASSCFAADRTFETETFLFSLDNESLALVFPQGLLVFGRLPDSDEQTNGFASFGCWEGDLFTPGEIQNL